MARIVLTDAKITIGGVILSDYITSVSLSTSEDVVDTSAFGGGGARTRISGLADNSVTFEFNQDFAAAAVEATIYPLVGTTTTVTIKPTNNTVSATCPLYTVSGTFLSAHTPVAGAVGELAMTTLSFTGGSVVKTTSP